MLLLWFCSCWLCFAMASGAGWSVLSSSNHPSILLPAMEPTRPPMAVPIRDMGR